MRCLIAARCVLFVCLCLSCWWSHQIQTCYCLNIDEQNCADTMLIALFCKHQILATIFIIACCICVHDLESGTNVDKSLPYWVNNYPSIYFDHDGQTQPIHSSAVTMWMLLWKACLHSSKILCTFFQDDTTLVITDLYWFIIWWHFHAPHWVHFEYIWACLPLYRSSYSVTIVCWKQNMYWLLNRISWKDNHGFGNCVVCWYVFVIFRILPLLQWWFFTLELIWNLS